MPEISRFYGISVYLYLAIIRQRIFTRFTETRKLFLKSKRSACCRALYQIARELWWSIGQPYTRKNYSPHGHVFEPDSPPAKLPAGLVYNLSVGVNGSRACL
jgi:hypothetical protein